MKFFRFDSPFSRTMSFLANLVLLNLATLLMSIPIITIGPTQAALYDMIGHLIREEDGSSILRDYFQTFRKNLKQGIALWIIWLLVAAVLLFGLFFYYENTTIPGRLLLFSVQIVLCWMWLSIATWLFPLQSRFANPVKITFKNAALCVFAYFPKTILMGVLNGLPFFCFLFFRSLFWEAGLLWVTGWFSLCALLVSLLLRKTFGWMEENTISRKK